MKIEQLVGQIQIVDKRLKYDANKAVNQLLTMRNWIIGYYIVAYEQNGEDRAKYGERLLQTLSERLNNKGLSYRNIRLFRQFFLVFPEIWQAVSAKSSNTTLPIWQTLSAILENKIITPSDLLTFSDERIELTSKIIRSLSFSHITLLFPLDDEQKRSFYAIEAIKGTWSVRELKRQINTLLFERSRLSKKPELLIKRLNIKLDTKHPAGLIKDIYTFEFLGLPIKDAVEETELESALLDHIREFILELGDGFCLEARQKRILIGDKYYFIDLVFYHRILRCHILIDLKVNEFNHQNAGQINTYLNYYKKKIKQEFDNDPIGILMVTNKNESLVEFATAGMDENLFVSKYLLKLPSKKKLEELLKHELLNL